MATFSSIAATNNNLVHKSTALGAFLAPITAAAISETTLFETGGGFAAAGLPTGYKDLGYLSEDGVRFGRSQETDAINSAQSITPVREEITSDTETIQVDCLEMNKQTIELYTGADLTSVTYTNGAFKIDKPEIPTNRYYRLLTLSVDTGSGTERVYGVFFPKVKVTTWGEQRFARTGALVWGVTLTSFKDDTLGYTRRTLFGGPALADVEVAMGLPAIA